MLEHSKLITKFTCWNIPCMVCASLLFTEWAVWSDNGVEICVSHDITTQIIRLTKLKLFEYKQNQQNQFSGIYSY